MRMQQASAGWGGLFVILVFLLIQIAGAFRRGKPPMAPAPKPVTPVRKPMPTRSHYPVRPSALVTEPEIVPAPELTEAQGMVRALREDGEEKHVTDRLHLGSGTVSGEAMRSRIIWSEILQPPVALRHE